MRPKDEMIRIRCKSKTKLEFKKFIAEREVINSEDALRFLMEYYRKTHHLTTGKVY